MSFELIKNNQYLVSKIFAGKRNISAKLALRIEKLLGTGAKYWLSMQMEYDLQEARKTALN